MSHRYSVSAVAATREDWGWLVLLGDIERMDGSPYLMLQLGHEFSEDDRRLGQDRPYIEISNQGWSWYGHIERIELRRSQVAVQMDQVAQQHMGNDGSFVFSFSLPDAEFEQLQVGMSRIFAASACYTANAA